MLRPFDKLRVTQHDFPSAFQNLKGFDLQSGERLHRPIGCAASI
jgi:hypothetical protein